jgi:pyruvate kinase
MEQHPFMQRKASADSAVSELATLLRRVTTLRDKIVEQANELLAEWGVDDAMAEAAPSLVNLAHYVAMRRHELSDLQDRLAAYGLSSLGRSEAKVLHAIEALIATLQRLCQSSGDSYPTLDAMTSGGRALIAECEKIFGPAHAGRHTYVMATLPPEAAQDEALIERLFAAGMDCARINCAHDDAGAWERMIANIKAAEAKFNRQCRIFMDVAGPKCRVAAVRAPEKFRAHRGDRLFICRELTKAAGKAIALVPSFPSVVAQLRPGVEVWINDGKIGARVVGVSSAGVEIEVVSARSKGERLKPEKGMNFPATNLNLSPLTRKDYADLDFIAEHADIVGFSFVQKPSDIALLQDHLAARRDGRPPQPIVLKIETPLAVHHLPELIVQSSIHNPTGVMIARGDLAVELGFARLSEIQEEMLWLCEAAHVPVIWATQVLDQYVKEGVMSRAETTDAAMAQHADCVMLNKGPYLPEGISLLSDILTRMERHHSKKFARLSILRAW